MHIKRLLKITLSCSVLLFLSSCMSSTIEEEINKIEQQNRSSKNKNEEVGSEKEFTPNNVELSKEQKEILDKLEKKDAKEALFENDLDIRAELNIDVPESRSSFSNPDELSQYLSYLFFCFYRGDIKAEEFLDEILKHAHSSYIEQLPIGRDKQINTLQSIQKKFNESLRSPLETYKITELAYQERVGEAAFYRKMISQNKQEIYYVTIIKKEGATWKLFDDSPSSPYLAPEFIEEKMIQEGDKR